MARWIVRSAIVCLLWTAGALAQAPTTASSAKPRTIVTTDMEQDDYDSLIRYLLYLNEVDTQGIIYTASRFHHAGDGSPGSSNRWTGNTTIEDQLMPAYAASYPNLKIHDPKYPTPEYLRGIIRLGNIDFVGEMAKDTPGSNLIKEKLLDTDPRPLWLQAWGGGNTIARALKSIEDQYKSTPEWTAISKKIAAKTVITFNSIGQDAVYANYIRPTWPDIQVYNMGGGNWGYQVRAYVPAPQPTNPAQATREDYFSGEWTKTNVLDVGPLGALYYTWQDGRQMAGDPAHTFGLIPYPCRPLPCPVHPKYSFISEGDNPAFLNLFEPGLRSWQDPTWGGYGGRATQNATTPSFWSANTRESDESGAPLASQALTAAVASAATSLQVAATAGFSAGDPIVVDGEATTIATVGTGVLNLAAPLAKAHAEGSMVAGYGRPGWGSGRYVTGQQRDFANRLRWTITKTYAAANHPPVVTVTGLDRRAAPGATVNLDGVVSDPDRHTLTSKWWQYKDVDTYTGAVAFSSSSAPKSSFVVPADAKPGQTIHAVLEVTDNGTPPLTRYARVVVTVGPR